MACVVEEEAKVATLIKAFSGFKALDEGKHLAIAGAQLVVAGMRQQRVALPAPSVREWQPRVARLR
eukprot:1518352-Prorocentrum_lima.AAC.1